MTLKEYLTKIGMRQCAFAAAIGASPSTVSRWIHGERHPEASAMRAVMEYTGGRVTANDFMADSASNNGKATR